MMSAIFARLDSRGLDYLRGRLANANPLGQRFLADVDLHAGTVYAVLPSPCLYNFAESICSVTEMHSSPQAITRAAVLEQVAAAFRVYPELAIICESYNLRASEIPAAVMEGRQAAPYLPGHTGHVGEFVYHLASSSDPEATVESVIHSAYEQPVGLSIIFRSSRAQFDIQGEDIAAILDEVVSSVVAISVSAYDGESLVIWQGPACHVFTGC
jgi:hypothetical protein